MLILCRCLWLIVAREPSISWQLLVSTLCSSKGVCTIHHCTQCLMTLVHLQSGSVKRELSVVARGVAGCSSHICTAITSLGCQACCVPSAAGIRPCRPRHLTLCEFLGRQVCRHPLFDLDPWLSMVPSLAEVLLPSEAAGAIDLPAGTQDLLRAALLATQSQLVMPIVISELTVDATAAEAPAERAPGISCAVQSPDVQPPERLQSANRLSMLRAARLICTQMAAAMANCLLPFMMFAGGNTSVSFAAMMTAGLFEKWECADLRTVRQLADDGPNTSLSGLTWRLDAGPGVHVTAAPLAHRLPCWGYVFQEAPQQGGLDPAQLQVGSGPGQN